VICTFLILAGLGTSSESSRMGRLSCEPCSGPSIFQASPASYTPSFEGAESVRTVTGSSAQTYLLKDPCEISSTSQSYVESVGCPWACHILGS